MQSIADLFAEYAAHHRRRADQWLHRLGIPLIMLSLLGMMARVTLATAGSLRIDLGMVLIAAAEAYYLALDWRLGAAMLAVLISLEYAGTAIPFWLNAALLPAGMALLFVGRFVYEKEPPAFTRNRLHLLVGPLWLVNEIVPVVKTLPAPRGDAGKNGTRVREEGMREGAQP